MRSDHPSSSSASSRGPVLALPPASAVDAREPAASWSVGRAQAPAASAGVQPASADAAAAPVVSAAAMALLGGRRALKQWPTSRTEIHGALVQGLPSTLLIHLLDQLGGLALDDVAAALGLSSRTLRRLREQPARRLPPDLASKAWQLAELLARAGAVFGGADAAQRWLAAPAMGLDGARPIDLLRTLQGSELVAEFLGRLEHGVYN